MKQRLLTLSGLLCLPAAAHDGHGLIGGHWHATDVLGFAVAGLIGLAVWLRSK